MKCNKSASAISERKGVASAQRRIALRSTISRYDKVPPQSDAIAGRIKALRSHAHLTQMEFANLGYRRLR
jgi:hypothetical protein